MLLAIGAHAGANKRHIAARCDAARGGYVKGASFRSSRQFVVTGTLVVTGEQPHFALINDIFRGFESELEFENRSPTGDGPVVVRGMVCLGDNDERQ